MTRLKWIQWFLATSLLLMGYVTPSWATTNQVEAVDRTLVSSRRVSRTNFEYTYTLTVTNHGSALTNVAGSLTSLSPNTVVADGDVQIGNLAAGETRQASDTFAIVQNRRYRFNPSDLLWDFVSDPAIPTNNMIASSLQPSTTDRPRSKPE